MIYKNNHREFDSWCLYIWNLIAKNEIWKIKNKQRKMKNENPTMGKKKCRKVRRRLPTIWEQPCITVMWLGLIARVRPTSTQIQQLGISIKRLSIKDRSTKKFSSPRGSSSYKIRNNNRRQKGMKMKGMKMRVKKMKGGASAICSTSVQ